MAKVRTISITPTVSEFIERNYKDKHDMSWHAAFDRFMYDYEQLLVRAEEAERKIECYKQTIERHQRLTLQAVKDAEIARLKEELEKQDQRIQEGPVGQQKEEHSDFFERLKYFEWRTKLAEKSRDQYKARCHELEEKDVSAINSVEERQFAARMANFDHKVAKTNLVLAEERLKRMTKERDEYRKQYEDLRYNLESLRIRPKGR